MAVRAFLDANPDPTVDLAGIVADAVGSVALHASRYDEPSSAAALRLNGTVWAPYLDQPLTEADIDELRGR